MYNKCLLLFFLVFIKVEIGRMFDEIFQIISNNKKIQLGYSLEPSVYTSQILSQIPLNKLNPHIEEWSDNKIE